MAEDLIVVTGATGNIGSVVASKLLEAGRGVLVIGREAGRLEPFVARGAQAAVGSLEDADFLATAFAGARGLFAMIPPNLQTPDFGAYANRTGEAIVSAIRRTGVPRVVNLSSYGANATEGTGPIKFLNAQEARLDAVEGLSVVHLRPGFFMENHLANIPTIRALGIVGTPARGDLPIPMIATRDIGAVAAGLLERSDFTGRTVRELLGAREYTYQEATAILGAAIGKPDLAYVQFPYEDARAALVAAGLTESVADLFVEMSRAINEGIVAPTQARSAETTTPTTLEAWAPVFAEAYAATAAAAH